MTPVEPELKIMLLAPLFALSVTPLVAPVMLLVMFEFRIILDAAVRVNEAVALLHEIGAFKVIVPA